MEVDEVKLGNADLKRAMSEDCLRESRFEELRELLGAIQDVMSEISHESVTSVSRGMASGISGEDLVSIRMIILKMIKE
jgi:hypothetical protein